MSAEQWAGKLLKDALTPPKSSRSLSRKIWADMPDEVRAKLPSDGASQHDRYIYDAPKSER